MRNEYGVDDRIISTFRWAGCVVIRGDGGAQARGQVATFFLQILI